MEVFVEHDGPEAQNEKSRRLADGTSLDKSDLGAGFLCPRFIFFFVRVCLEGPGRPVWPGSKTLETFFIF